MELREILQHAEKELSKKKEREKYLLGRKKELLYRQDFSKTAGGSVPKAKYDNYFSKLIPSKSIKY